MSKQSRSPSVKSSGSRKNGKLSPAGAKSGRTSRKTSPSHTNYTPYIIGGLVALLAVAFALFIIAPWNTGPGNSPIPVGSDSSASIEQFPEEGRNHVQNGSKVQYQTNPPTSGDHYPNWSRWGVFNPAPVDELIVHNLEHGGIIIFYDCPDNCPTSQDKLASYANRYSPDAFVGVMVAPRSNLPNDARIALVSWQHRLLLKSLDVDKINDFILKRFNKGPEIDPNARPMV
jgi:hypothetical protein